MATVYGDPEVARKFEQKIIHDHTGGFYLKPPPSGEIELTKDEVLTIVKDGIRQALKNIPKPQPVKENQTAIANPIKETQEKLRKQIVDLKEELKETNQKNSDLISKLESLLRRPFQMRGANMGYVILQNKLAKALRELRNEFPS